MSRPMPSIGLVLAVLAFAPSPGRAESVAPEPQVCTVRNLLDTVRAGVQHGSPAYRRYVRTLLKEAALKISGEALTAAFNEERDPVMVEALGAALATKASFSEAPELVQAVLGRAASDGDPAARAASVRALRATGSVETMAKNGNAVTYEQLVRDAAPEVRRAVADNLAAENTEVYSGHSRELSEAAVRTAVAATDPEIAASVLAQVSMEQIGAESVGQLRRMLSADDARVRAAAAAALGEAPVTRSAGVTGDLSARYRNEQDPEVRKAILQAIARQGQAGAIRNLTELRGVAPALDTEIDAWLSALKLGLQEWIVILREKQRLSSSTL